MTIPAAAAAAAGVRFEALGLTLGARAFVFNGCIAPGRITAVTGMSGSGKSTLLNLIAGFERPASGKVWIGEREVTALRPADRPLSLVFQDHNLFAHLDLATNIGLGIDPALRLTAADRSAISTALARVGLAGQERRLPASLSGGERQRAAFARVLVRRRPLLLMDEPFAALDPGLRGDMAGLLLALHRETGATVVIVSHDRGEVERLADDLLFIEDGRIALCGTRAAVLGRRDHPGLARFLGACSP